MEANIPVTLESRWHSETTVVAPLVGPGSQHSRWVPGQGKECDCDFNGEEQPLIRSRVLE